MGLKYRLLKQMPGQVKEVEVVLQAVQITLGEISGGCCGANIIEEGKDIGALFAQQSGKALDVCLAIAMEMMNNVRPVLRRMG